jgi:hypothetical protein
MFVLSTFAALLRHLCISETFFSGLYVYIRIIQWCATTD